MKLSPQRYMTINMSLVIHQYQLRHGLRLHLLHLSTHPYYLPRRVAHYSELPLQAFNLLLLLKGYLTFLNRLSLLKMKIFKRHHLEQFAPMITQTPIGLS